MAEEREKLLEVKELVSQRKFEEALAILRTMPDNPTAQKWQAQVEDAMARQNQPGEREAPKPAARASADTPTEADFRGSRQPENAIRAEVAGSDDDGPVDMDKVREQAGAALDALGVDRLVALKALAVAAVAGLLAALLDAILGLPAGTLVFAFGWIVAALNGPAYAIWRGKTDRAAWVMAAVAGLVAYLVWFIVMEILTGEPNWREDEINAYNVFKSWRNEYMNILKVMLTGAIVGLLGLAWHALLPLVPSNLSELQQLPGKIRQGRGE